MIRTGAFGGAVWHREARNGSTGQALSAAVPGTRRGSGLCPRQEESPPCCECRESLRRPRRTGHRQCLASRLRPARAACISALDTGPRHARVYSASGMMCGRRLSLLPALALLLGALSPVAPTPAEAQTTVWSATLTADESAGFFGCDNDDATQDNCSTATVLTDDDFTYQGRTYTVTKLYWGSSRNKLTFGDFRALQVRQPGDS